MKFIDPIAVNITDEGPRWLRCDVCEMIMYPTYKNRKTANKGDVHSELENAFFGESTNFLKSKKDNTRNINLGG